MTKFKKRMVKNTNPTYAYIIYIINNGHFITDFHLPIDTYIVHPRHPPFILSIETGYEYYYLYNINNNDVHENIIRT